jgi:hypothetical protein
VTKRSEIAQAKTKAEMDYEKEAERLKKHNDMVHASLMATCKFMLAQDNRPHANVSIHTCLGVSCRVNAVVTYCGLHVGLYQQTAHGRHCCSPSQSL